MHVLLDLRRPDPAGPDLVDPAGYTLKVYQHFLGHDLPGLLVPVQGYARLLAAGEGPAEERELAGRLADIVQRTDARTRRLAELGRLAREAAFGPPVDVAEVAQEAIARVSCLSPGLPGGCAVRCELPALGLSRSFLFLVLVELLRNASQSGLTGRPVSAEVRATSFPLPEDWPDREIISGETLSGETSWAFALRVSDNGRGFPVGAQDGLAEPGRGGGLGLPLVRQIVARWRGGLQIHSLPGQGTTVTVLLTPNALAAREVVDSCESGSQPR